MVYPVTVRGESLIGKIDWDYSDEDCLVILLSYPDGQHAVWTEHLEEEEYQDIERQVRSQMS